MATIGHLAVKISANTQSLDKGLRRSQTQVSQFKRGVNKAAFALRASFAAGAAVAIGALYKLSSAVREQFGVIDDIAKFSDRIGIATEQLAGLRLAGKLAGVDARSLQMAMQRMTRRVSEAAMGMGEARDAIVELGLDARKLNMMSADQQLRAVADAMQQIPNQADRVRLAFKLFDSEGVALLQLLQNGSAHLDMVQAKAERLGLTFSRDMAAQVEQANDAVTLMNASFDGLARQLAIAVAPAIKEVADIVSLLLADLSNLDVVMDKIVTNLNLLLTYAGQQLGLIDEEELASKYRDVMKAEARFRMRQRGPRSQGGGSETSAFDKSRLKTPPPVATTIASLMQTASAFVTLFERWRDMRARMPRDAFAPALSDVSAMSHEFQQARLARIGSGVAQPARKPEVKVERMDIVTRALNTMIALLRDSVTAGAHATSGE